MSLLVMGSPKEGFIIEAWGIVNGLYVETSTQSKPKKTNHLCVKLGELPKFKKNGVGNIEGNH
jgi:hypothetical protein